MKQILDQNLTQLSEKIISENAVKSMLADKKRSWIALLFQKGLGLLLVCSRFSKFPGGGPLDQTPPMRGWGLNPPPVLFPPLVPLALRRRLLLSHLSLLLQIFLRTLLDI